MVTASVHLVSSTSVVKKAVAIPHDWRRRDGTKASQEFCLRRVVAGVVRACLIPRSKVGGELKEVEGEGGREGLSKGTSRPSPFLPD